MLKKFLARDFSPMPKGAWGRPLRVHGKTPSSPLAIYRVMDNVTVEKDLDWEGEDGSLDFKHINGDKTSDVVVEKTESVGFPPSLEKEIAHCGSNPHDKALVMPIRVHTAYRWQGEQYHLIGTCYGCVE